MRRDDPMFARPARGGQGRERTGRVRAAPAGTASRTALAAAWPNPFQSGVTVAFELARECDVSLEVYDLHGARVRTLAEGRWAAGRHEVRWDEGAGGRPVPAGIYFVRFAADAVVSSRRIVKIE